jgi:hypothetical protein
MTDALKKLIVDLESGTQQYIDLTAEEIQQRELDSIAFATEQAESEEAAIALAEAKASAEAKLTALGLTSDEVAAIIGR